MEFEINPRQSVIVYLSHLRQAKQLRKFGTINYVSRNMKYVVLYMDQAKVEENVKKMQKLRFIKKIEISARPTLRTEYSSQTASEFKPTEEDQEKFKQLKEAGKIV
ncbi:Uncharacterized protein YlbG, UPF0298 family [Ligilactobacillus sp. WC1T17]|uniref:UPF0298 protein SAMN05216431_104179 n=1 Tax=Ligilactobacillus ruminis TaxID=1623 RepID=A0ABY1AAZ1_9LACO|nr:Uncharacterized protein YlbG, UPF0298 family [Ligilactobacillus ruminis]